MTAMKMPNTIMAASRAASGMRSASAAGPKRRPPEFAAGATAAGTAGGAARLSGVSAGGSDKADAPDALAASATTPAGATAGSLTPCSTGRAAASPSLSAVPAIGEAADMSDLADHAFNQVVHLLQHRVGLLQRGAGGDDFLAGVVLERALEYLKGALHHGRLDAVGLGLGGRRHGLAVGRHFHEAVLEAAAHEVLEGLALHGVLGVHGVHREPVPFGAGEVALGRQRRLVGVVAAGKNAALFGGFHDDLGAVHVTGDHVHALVHHAVGGLGFLHRQRPVAGHDELAGDLGIDAAGAHQEGVAVAQHLGNGLGGDEADFLALAGEAGNHAVQVLALVDVAEVAAGVLGMLAFGPHAAAVGEAHIGVFFRHLDHVRIEVTEGGGENQPRAVLLHHGAHGLLHVGGLGHLLLLHHLHAGHFLQRRGGLGL